MDVGAFASALEFACDLKSEVVGKPSRQFFGAALSDIGVPAEEVCIYKVYCITVQKNKCL